MKLSAKIFIGICIPAIIAISIISTFVINVNFNNSIESETQMAISDIENIEKNINQNITLKKDNLIEAIAKIYEKKDIQLCYYGNNVVKFSNNEELFNKNIDLISVGEGKYNSKIIENYGNYYLLVSTQIESQEVIIYAKKINNIYEERNILIKNCTYIFLILLVIIAIIAYIISKSLTKPLINMKREMIKLSKGNYNIHLKEGKDEFGRLSVSFNKMSDEIENRNKELMDLIDSKQLFIDNLSHEMNTPLTSIQGYAELIEKANLNDEQKIKFLRYIQDESKRLQDMYKKLLLISYKKKGDFIKKKVYTKDIFKEIKNTFNMILKCNSINLKVNNCIEYIDGDETLIVMAIMNLIKNAISVSKEGNTIVVDTFELNGKKYVCVKDQGTGISKEDIDKIIEPFYRVDKDRSRKNGGAGIGLSICKSIMDLHGGRLKVESELGVGSNFILEF